MTTASPKAPLAALKPTAPPVLPVRGLLLEDELVVAVEPLVTVTTLPTELVCVPPMTTELVLPPVLPAMLELVLPPVLPPVSCK